MHKANAEMRKCGRDEVAYPEPGKTSNIELFAKVNSEWHMLTVFEKTAS